MTLIEVAPAIETTPPEPDKPIEHRACCKDHSKGLCGQKLDPTTVHPYDGESEDDCVVCDDLWKTTFTCPGGKGLCMFRVKFDIGIF